MKRILPENPHLGHLRRQAKDLLRQLNRQHPQALQRITVHPDRRSLLEPGHLFRLHEAQLVVAREYGFPSWNALQASVLERKTMHTETPSRPAARRIGTYTAEEAAALTGLTTEEVRLTAAKLHGPHTYLDALILERIWVTARPFVVAIRRKDGTDFPREFIPQIQQMLLDAGGILTPHLAQLRCRTLEEAQKAAHRMPEVEGAEWFGMEQGTDQALDHQDA